MRSVTEIQEELALYETARNKILEGNQSWSVGASQYTRADLRTIHAAIRSLRQELEFATDSGDYGAKPVIFGGRR